MRELAQTFRFPGATEKQLAHVLATAPLVGAASIFGKRTVAATTTEADVRKAIGFEPAPMPLLRFDVEMRQQVADSGTLVIVEISQPGRRRPYLAGQFVWQLTDDADAAVLQEEINTPTALAIVSRPLDGSGPSLRRWLFFVVGHERVMRDVAANLRALLAEDPASGD
ncbi:MAG: hypothetical protein OEV40_19540 [Acidimicrobiia bacterium]|nr:hypothetical protein [Acidimicrobiia bacterium]